MLALPSVRNHSTTASSPSEKWSVAPLHVARPHNTPLNVEPDSLAKYKVFWNKSADTPALK